MAFGVYTFSTIPKNLYPGSRLVVVYLVNAGVGATVTATDHQLCDDDVNGGMLRQTPGGGNRDVRIGEA